VSVEQPPPSPLLEKEGEFLKENIMNKLSRRDFLKLSALASSTLLIPKFLTPLQAKEINELLGSDPTKKLVIIQLSGGNDGLNTIIPYNNDVYYSGRDTISVAKNNVIKINDELGFNPAPTAASLYCFQ